MYGINLDIKVSTVIVCALANIIKRSKYLCNSRDQQEIMVMQFYVPKETTLASNPTIMHWYYCNNTAI